MSIVNLRILLHLVSEGPAFVTDLSRDLRLSVPYVSREVQRLHRAGHLRKERVGRKVSVIANVESPVVSGLKACVLACEEKRVSAAEVLLPRNNLAIVSVDTLQSPQL